MRKVIAFLTMALLVGGLLFAAGNAEPKAGDPVTIEFWTVNKYIFITLPMLASTISIYVILQIIGIMSFLFSYIHVMTAGGPGYSSTVLEYFIYVNIFKLQEIGKGSAAGVILIIFTMIIIYTWLFLSMKNEKKNRREMARAEK